MFGLASFHNRDFHGGGDFDSFTVSSALAEPARITQTGCSQPKTQFERLKQLGKVATGVQVMVCGSSHATNRFSLRVRDAGDFKPLIGRVTRLMRS